MLSLVLRQYGLVGVSPRHVRAGNNNEHWFAGRYVLRRYRETRIVESIVYEHAILAHLHSHGWPIAVALPSQSGGTVVRDEGRLYALFPRLPGRRGNPARPRNARALGRLLARLHGDLASFSAVPSPGLFMPLLRYDQKSTGNGSHTLPDLLKIYESSHPRIVRYVRNTAEATWQESRYVDLDAFENTLIHGDWHDGNMLYSQGELTGVLDFDFAHVDLRVADLAISAMVTDADAALELIRAYLEVEHVHADELQLISLLERLRILGAVAAILSMGLQEPARMASLPVLAERLVLVETRWPAISRGPGLS